MISSDTHVVARADGKSTPVWLVWVSAFVVATALYVATANRGAQWQDSGLQQLRIVNGQIENSRGLALTHPLQYYLGRAAIRLPAIEPAFAITLVSALAGAIAVANLTAAIWLLTQRAAAAIIPATALMLSHTFWQHATHTESYALVAALLSAEWLCLAAYARSGRAVFLVLLGLANGLGVANHLLAILVTPIDAVVIGAALRRKKLSARQATTTVALWLAGTLPFTLLVASQALATGELVETLRSALFGKYSDAVLNISLGPRILMLSAGYVGYNLPGLTVPLAILGVLVAWRHSIFGKWLAPILLAELLLYAAFVFRYAIADQYTFFFPVYMLLTIFAGFGLTRVLTWRRGPLRTTLLAASVLTALWTPIVYLGVCDLMHSRGALQSMVGAKPYRDGYRTFFVPWGIGDDAAARVNIELARLIGVDGLILVADPMIGFGVRYAQAVGRIPSTVEISLIDQTSTSGSEESWRIRLGEAFEAGRPIVQAPRDRDAPELCAPDAIWTRVGDLYRFDGFRTPPN